ncbi:Cytochrome c [Caulifigura coniformis]|uniref:Cytochrome c n=1 Tax=Caulifigura coniformis TaxID=2527983 RepID=A0A517S913_9PLAN|nr:family 16 glycoside hydrolase [Caulifigura coniformis]QDT52625.1 Cytochrome c [Caulifigura coniformis]
MLRATLRPMFVAVCLLVAGSQQAFTADPVAKTPEAAAADPDYALQGEYETERLGVQVVAQGDGEFQIVRFTGGLPGAGWNGKERQVIDGDADAVREIVESLKLKKVTRKSPTLGAPAPAGATSLFDGTQKSLDEHWKAGTRMSPDGLLIPAATTKESFTDFAIHLEFRLPYLPKARGQGRANSGMYLQGRYEVQILDSFGLEGKNNECGGLYSLRDPDLNMCLPPLEWQTYDAEFVAPRWDENGKRKSNARMTIRLNGVPVHQDVELAKLTPGPLLKDDATPGPLFLQDHGNPVRFRNIWIARRDAEKEARRPIVPSFERLHASASPASAEGGVVLLTELGCVNCHASDDPAFKVNAARSGPTLDEIGLRARGDWLAKFLASPHGVKPGTTMPALLDHLPEADRKHAAAALTSYLVGNLSPLERNGDRTAAKRGDQLFHSIGCVACHAPRKGDAPRVNAAATIPLPVLGDKYSLTALEKFLKDPIAIRPAGRMPSLNLNDKEARDLACYLVSDSSRSARPNIRYTVYHGVWETPPDFSSVKPVSTGECEGFDLSVAGRDDAFGIVFEGYWNVDVESAYTFFLNSDDGSKLYVDDELIASYGGPFTKVPPRVLAKGVHKIRVEYVEAFGEQHLTLEMQGRGIQRQPIESWLRLTPEEAASGSSTPATDGSFVADAALAEKGRTLFSSLGCAACHRKVEDDKPLSSTLEARHLKDLNPARGCLADSSTANSSAPKFDLSPTQKAAITAALSVISSGNASKRDLVAATMASFNCYACHRRDGMGGPERDRDPLFLTSQHEMGDEGRVPPPLDGVGDKLQPGWMKRVIGEGAKDRPYMLTRMPRFGAAPVDQVVAAFAKADQKQGPKPPEIDEAEHRTKAVGRRLAGNNAFGCVKCHVFGGTPSSGIQTINLLTMTRRVREDWFYRYLIDPQAYRPGTRMPTAFVDGRSVVRDVYEGAPEQQMKALWSFLSDREKAAVPDGLIAQSIELVPKESPIIYRNFLDGLTPRGIAVGYPEQADLAWDAEKMSLAALWHGKFVDASRHWTGRGADRISPLGDHVIHPETTAPIAVLPSQDAPWPAEPPRTLGYRFRGYRLDDQQRPVFKYTVPAGGTFVTVEDAFVPAVDLGKPAEPGMRRTLTVTGEPGVHNVYLRVARGMIDDADAPTGAYSIDGEWKVRINPASAVTPFLRGAGKQAELLLPIALTDGKASVVLEISW